MRDGSPALQPIPGGRTGGIQHSGERTARDCATLVPVAAAAHREEDVVTSKMRSRTAVRGIVTGLSAVALLLGATACTGGEGEDPADGGGTRAEGTSDGGVAEPSQETPAPSDSGGESATSPFADAELDAASQRLLDALQVLDDQDWEAACAMVLDPSTGTAPEGERLQECVDRAEPALGEQAGSLEPGAFDALDVSMIEASDNGDDTVALSILGEDLGIPMAPGDDGRWYLVIPF